MNDDKSKRFRSVLPHESLPLNEEFGYVHIQGGFTPKVVVEEDNEDDNDITADESGPRSTKSKAPSIESLKQYMAKFFMGKTNKNDSVMKSLPHTNLVKIEIDIDGNKDSENNESTSPLFTKARLHYPSPEIARDVVSYIRSTKLTPSQIFQNISIGNDNNDLTPDDESYSFQYSSKAMQASQVSFQVCSFL